MARPIGQRLLQVAGALVVLAGSFMIALKVLDTWWPTDPTLREIHVVEATYGKNCGGVKAGNATAVLSRHCEGARDSCTFTVDAAEIGDPSAGCAKDFWPTWRCGGDATPHRGYLAPEAHSHRTALTCP